MGLSWTQDTLTTTAGRRAEPEHCVKASNPPTTERTGILTTDLKPNGTKRLRNRCPVKPEKSKG